MEPNLNEYMQITWRNIDKCEVVTMAVYWLTVWEKTCTMQWDHRQHRLINFLTITHAYNASEHWY